MNVLVTGANGMLGRDLCALLGERHRVTPFTRAQADVTDLEALLRGFRSAAPEVVVHCAASASVDGCEQDPAHAYRQNTWGAWAAATAAEAVGARFVLISTDFVFDGTLDRAYTEFDPVRPINVYGASKAAAEQACRSACRRLVVARLQWLYGRHGPSFVRAVLNAAAAGKPLRVVTDQVGVPSYTRHVARKLVWLCEQPCDGVYHVANRGEASRWEWAREIVRLAGWEEVHMAPIESSEWPTPAGRPARSILRRLALEMRGADDLPPWQEGLGEFIAELRAAGELPERFEK